MRESPCAEIPTKDQSLIQRLSHAIATSLRGDRWRWEEEAGVEVEALLGSDPQLHREVCHLIKGWHWDAANRATPPPRVSLERIMAERVELYSYIPPPGANIPISVEPFPVDDSVPTEDKIEWEVKRLRNHRSGGTSVIWAEQMKGWLVAAQKK